jgi:hypothetical protein
MERKDFKKFKADCEELLERVCKENAGCDVCVVADYYPESEYYVFGKLAVGVPSHFHHRELDEYLPKIIRQGIKVAICS